MIGSFIAKPYGSASKIAKFYGSSCVAVGSKYFLASNHQDASHVGTTVTDGTTTWTVKKITQVPASVFEATNSGTPPDIVLIEVNEAVPHYHALGSFKDLGLTDGSAVVFGAWGTWDNTDHNNAGGPFTWTVGTVAEKWANGALSASSVNKYGDLISGGIWSYTYTAGTGNACPVLYDSGGGVFYDNGSALVLVGILTGGDVTGIVSSGTQQAGAIQVIDYPVINWLRQQMGQYPQYARGLHGSYKATSVSELSTGQVFSNLANATGSAFPLTYPVAGANCASVQTLTGATTNRRTKATKWGTFKDSAAADINLAGITVDKVVCTVRMSFKADTLAANANVAVPSIGTFAGAVNTFSFASSIAMTPADGTSASTAYNASGQVLSTTYYQGTYYRGQDVDGSGALLSDFIVAESPAFYVQLNALAQLSVKPDASAQTDTHTWKVAQFQLDVYKRVALGGPPTISDATTAAGVMVDVPFARNVGDDAGVKYVLVTGFTKGTLYQNNGTTPITPNTYISLTAGAYTFKFKPWPNQSAIGAVRVRSAVETDGSGLSDEVSAAITITGSAPQMARTRGRGRR